jgi:hypothetical protein
VVLHRPNSVQGGTRFYKSLDRPALSPNLHHENLPSHCEDLSGRHRRVVDCRRSRDDFPVRPRLGFVEQEHQKQNLCRQESVVVCVRFAEHGHRLFDCPAPDPPHSPTAATEAGEDRSVLCFWSRSLVNSSLPLPKFYDANHCDHY